VISASGAGLLREEETCWGALEAARLLPYFTWSNNCEYRVLVEYLMASCLSDMATSTR